MTNFIAKSPTRDASWRAVVLFGRNVASYKFALAKTLLGMADRADERVTLEELAAPFSQHLCEHLKLADTQTTSRSSKFLDACRAFNRDQISKDRLVSTTTQLGFTNVIDAFHVVGNGPVPFRFFEDERKGQGAGVGAIRLTDDFRHLVSSLQGSALADEAEARWRLVEMAWELDLPGAGVAVQADAARDLLFVEVGRRIKRVDLTRVRSALSGYQRGRCFYCESEISPATTDVDHFFPWVLRERGLMADADGVWNLVLSCRACNRGEGGKFAAVPSPRLMTRLHERNNWLVDSHHPLRETIIKQTGSDDEARASFLRGRQQVAIDALIREWEPEGTARDG